MRIVLLQAVVALGGFEQHTLNLATGLQRLGHEVHIMGLINAGGFDLLRDGMHKAMATPEYQQSCFERYQLRHHNISCHFPAQWPQDPRAAWQMLADLEPDIVNVQLPVPQLALEQNRAPVVGTIHSEFSLDAVPQCDAGVCLDQRWHGLTCNTLNVRIHALRNGIDLERFPYRPNVADREGVAAWGRFDPTKLGPARAICDTVPVDCWGDAVPLRDTGLRVKGFALPEEICYNYRIITATGLCALEAMACGALLLTPEPTEERMAAWADMSFWLEGIYPPGPGADETVRLDLASLMTLSRGEAQGRADFCRQCVEREHDCVKMAEKFVDVYESVL